MTHIVSSEHGNSKDRTRPEGGRMFEQRWKEFKQKQEEERKVQPHTTRRNTITAISILT
jgi:hypothetical protein